MVLLSKVDLISPKITLYYNGNPKHYVLSSSILSIVTYIVIFALSVNFFVQFFHRNIFSSYFSSKFVEDIGEYPLNSSSLFHYISLNNSKNEIDYKAIHIIGIQQHISQYKINNDLSRLNHWVYGRCTLEDFGDLSYLIRNLSELSNTACIRKMWDFKRQKYFYSDEKDFYYPSVRYGTSNGKNIFYGIVVEKCRNFSTIQNMKKVCRSEEQINEYLNQHYSIDAHIVDNSLELGNYSHPITKNILRITNEMNDNIYKQSHLNFYPINIKTHIGSLFDSIREKSTYIYNHIDIRNIDVGNTGILSCYYFWFQNRLQIYERKYLKFQNLLAEIGGIIKLTLICAYFINSFFYKFGIIIDTSSMYKPGKEISRGNTLNNENTEKSGNNFTLSNQGVFCWDKTLTTFSFGEKKITNPKKPKFSFCEYFKSKYLFFLSVRFRKQKFQKLENFRKIYLSEENLMQLYFLKEKFLMYPVQKSDKVKTNKTLVKIQNFFNK